MELTTEKSVVSSFFVNSGDGPKTAPDGVTNKRRL